MARAKEFDRETALLGAIDVFAEHGYEGASTEALVRAMKIGRQSLYDTFGDKWRLYLEAVQRYTADSVSEQLQALNAPRAPLAGLRALLTHAVEQAIAAPSPRCLGISATCEFGRSNRELTILAETAARTLHAAIERRLREARAEGAVADEVDPRAAAGFLKATLIGIKVSARGGASPESLRGIAQVALRSLR